MNVGRGVLSLGGLVMGLAVATAGFAAKTLDLTTVGSFKTMIHEGHLEPRATLSSVLRAPHAYALGALGRLDGEFVVLDGQAYLSRPRPDGQIVNSRSTGADSVTLMVASHVVRWKEFRIDRPTSLAELEGLVVAHAKACGLPERGPFPFLIDGPLKQLQWHVMDGRKLPPGPMSHEAHAAAAIRGGGDVARASLLGFYSDHHTGVFLHHDINVHVHVLFPESGQASHVDSVVVAPGAVLRLPWMRTS